MPWKTDLISKNNSEYKSNDYNVNVRASSPLSPPSLERICITESASLPVNVDRRETSNIAFVSVRHRISVGRLVRKWNTKIPQRNLPVYQIAYKN